MSSITSVLILAIQSNSTRNFAIDFVFLRMWVCQRLETILLGKSRETLAVYFALLGDSMDPLRGY